MDFGIGIACGGCDTFSPMGTAACPACGRDLALISDEAYAASTHAVQPSAARAAEPAQLSEEELMEQARNYVCRECAVAVPSGHKFCGTCGAAVPPEVIDMQAKYFGAMQAPGKARLILIRGDAGAEGLSYMLQGTEHIAGRDDGQILFPDDRWMSPRHANFVYEGNNLVVRDEGSVNGVFIRVREPVALSAGDEFLCGEQLFRVAAQPPDDSGPDQDQTYFYSSPKPPSAFRVEQVLAGGIPGGVHCAHENTVTIGREDCDVNFPLDVYMSARHASVEYNNAGFILTDLDSKNGTYARIKQVQPLQHGDYLFLGRQLLRVELTT